ncbi:uncharacterized protein LOC129742085 [Uranotaenia lowii]|uniref:uncharacterized protein LOC129742085 n=1 Tax=Uranotaenia lowii TaxID=190385 RepID=UPI002478849F|nr:uncharacterized protein LOC129742085 [Uranotaenia lowii]
MERVLILLLGFGLVQSFVIHDVQEAYSEEIDEHSLNTIYNKLYSLADQYDEAEIIHFTLSNGNVIPGIKVSFSSSKLDLALEGGIDRTGWITPAVLVYFAEELLTSENPLVRSLAEIINWQIFPTMSPDAYEHPEVFPKNEFAYKFPVQGFFESTADNQLWVNSFPSLQLERQGLIEGIPRHWISENTDQLNPQEKAKLLFEHLIKAVNYHDQAVKPFVDSTKLNAEIFSHN